MRSRMLHLRIEIRSNARETFEVALDELLRVGVRDLQLLRQRVGALTVDRRKVDRLGARTHLAGDFAQWYLEDQCGRLPMDVSPGLERFHECRVAREVRQESELDLRVVRREKDMVCDGNESAANIPS